MTDHLDALRLRLSNEKTRLSAETTGAGRAFRARQIAQVEREIAHEERFLAKQPENTMSDDELLNALLED